MIITASCETQALGQFSLRPLAFIAIWSKVLPNIRRFISTTSDMADSIIRLPFWIGLEPLQPNSAVINFYQGIDERVRSLAM